MKKISLILLSLVFTCLFSSGCFAATLPELPGSYQFYTIYKRTPDTDSSVTDSTYFLIESKENYPVTEINDNGSMACRLNNLYYNEYIYVVGTDTEWRLLNERSNVDGQFVELWYCKPGFVLSYLNHNLIKSDGTVVFHKAPITAITSKMLLGAMTHLHYLIPCLLGLVIFLIAFKKAWAWLKNQLLI